MSEDQNKNELPKGWKWVKVGKYVISVKGKKPKHVSSVKTKECPIPYINIKAFEKNIIDEYTDGVGCALCEDGDFLMVWDGSRSGYVGKAIKGALGSTLVKLNFPNIENNYAYYFLQSKYVEINTRAKGVGIPHVDPSILWNYDLLIPPNHIQQAIVSKIEELFSELDKAIENLRTAQQQLKIYRQSVLKWAFEGRFTNKNVKEGTLPNGWKWVNIEFLLSDKKKGMGTGPFGTMLKKSEHQKSGVPVLGIENIGEGVFQMPNKIFVTHEKATELKNFRVKEHDVIISRSGTVGEICLLPKAMQDSIISTNLIRVSLSLEILNPKFFVYLFQGGKVRQQVFDLCKGSSRVFLNQTILNSIDFPYCSSNEQSAIVEAIEDRLSVADKMEESISQSLQQAEALRQSILKKAFEGRLVVEKDETQGDAIPMERKILAGKIIHLFHDDKYFGLTKFQKTLCIAEHHAQVEYEMNYLQERAGPYDRDFTLAFRKEMKEQDWFLEETKVSMTHFIPGENVGKLIKGYAKYFRERSSKITFVLKLFKDKTLMDSELIATLYVTWNNRIISKKTVTEDALIDDIYRWSAEKKKYTKDGIREMYKWMIDVKLIPTGFGKLIGLEND